MTPEINKYQDDRVKSLDAPRFAVKYIYENCLFRPEFPVKCYKFQRKVHYSFVVAIQRIEKATGCLLQRDIILLVESWALSFNDTSRDPSCLIELDSSAVSDWKYEQEQVAALPQGEG